MARSILLQIQTVSNYLIVESRLMVRVSESSWTITHRLGIMFVNTIVPMEYIFDFLCIANNKRINVFNRIFS